MIPTAIALGLISSHLAPARVHQCTKHPPGGDRASRKRRIVEGMGHSRLMGSLTIVTVATLVHLSLAPCEARDSDRTTCKTFGENKQIPHVKA
ncbi:Uncharacterized protein HZ326_0796 [Fusarium oxysporum f. sp. albedinis]|nr:Uncharacterized protein HZ326_0796 [Fusarium oxysporum f. sp. albedinis]